MTAVVYVLTALAALVVVLTWLRLGRRTGSMLPLWHLLCGVVAVVVWVIFLVAPSSSVLGGDAVGIVGLGFWWLVTIVGLLILARWRSSPRGGRHAGRRVAEGRSSGWLLPLLAHGGMVIAVIVMTWAYLTQKV